jgi:hypothetical protein
MLGGKTAYGIEGVEAVGHGAIEDCVESQASKIVCGLDIMRGTKTLPL